MKTINNYRTWFYNPFEYIAGYKALLIGLVVMIGSTYIGTMNGSHFDGAFDMHIGKVSSVSLMYLESFISWFVTALIFYITGIIVSGTSVRIIDIFGTMAFARIPLIISVFVGFSPVMHNLSAMMPTDPQKAMEQLVAILPSLLLISIPLFISIIWMITLMVFAFKVSCNLKGGKLAASFTIALIVSEVVTKTLIFVIYRNCFALPVMPGM